MSKHIDYIMKKYSCGLNDARKISKRQDIRARINAAGSWKDLKQQMLRLLDYMEKEML